MPSSSPPQDSNLSSQPQNDLFAAAKAGNLDNIEKLFENSIDVNAQDKDGNTALIIAADNGQLAVVNYLLENGADVKYTNKIGQTALSYATIQNHNEVVSCLLKKDIPLKHIDRALFFATHTPDPNDIKSMLTTYLLSKDINELLVEAVNGGCLQIIDYLLENDLSLDRSSVITGLLKKSEATLEEIDTALFYANQDDYLKNDEQTLLIQQVL